MTMRIRAPKPCPTCGRTGNCAECCCISTDHVHGRPVNCRACGHATREATPKTRVTCTCGTSVTIRKDGSMRRHLDQSIEGERVDRLCKSTSWRTSS